MSFIATIANLVLHLDKNLIWLVQNYGLWVYGIIFLIIFLETGIFLAPFLPGDSLLFAAGAIAATGSLKIAALFGLLALAAILGDTANYFIGNKIGASLIKRNSRWIKKRHIDKTIEYFKIYGGNTIILARFIPIVRTFAPFLAGVGAMRYSRFIIYNIIGGIAWVSLFLFGGYFFGNLPFVKNNFGVIIVAIILISLTPLLVEYIKYRRTHNHKKSIK